MANFTIDVSLDDFELDGLDFNVDKKILELLHKNSYSFSKKSYNEYLIELKQLYLDFCNFYKNNPDKKQPIMSFSEFVESIIIALILLKSINTEEAIKQINEYREKNKKDYENIS
jgi:hypothetical protein